MPNQFFRIGFFAQSGESNNVGEQNRGGHARPFQRIEVAAGVLEDFFDQILGDVTLQRASGAQLFHPLDDVVDPERANAAEQERRKHGHSCEKEAGLIVGNTHYREINYANRNQEKQ